MPGLTLAAINPDNTPHGYNLTFAFPMLLFIAIIVILYMLFSRPHRRVPGRPISLAGSSGPRAASVAQARSPGGAHLTASVDKAAGTDNAAGAEAGPEPDSASPGAASDPANPAEEAPEAPE